MTGYLRHEETGQATVEAALLLPVLMLCIALLVQPALILYTRAVMQSAAAEGCRLIATAPVSGETSEATWRAYIRRRLAAVPDADIFHGGGEQGWVITCDRLDDGHTAQVSIQTSVHPLPLLGVIPAILGSSDGAGNILLRVEVTATVRPAWLEGDYDDWTAIWDKAEIRHRSVR